MFCSPLLISKPGYFFYGILKFPETARQVQDALAFFLQPYADAKSRWKHSDRI